MAAVILKQGSPVMVDHTPGSAVAAGDVVVVSASPRVCHRAIEANKLGALAVFGGVYLATGNGAIANGAKVYWDNATGKMSTTAGSLKVFGEAVSACSGDDATFLVFHNPGTL